MSKRKNTTSSIPSKTPKHWSLGLIASMKDPNSIIKNTEKVVVIKDKYPKAKVHYLVLPHEEINSIYKLNKSHISLLEEFGNIFKELKEENESELRAGFHAIPSMQRMHMHVISTDMISTSLKTKIHWNSFCTKFFIPYDGEFAIHAYNISYIFVDCVSLLNIVSWSSTECYCVV